MTLPAIYREIGRRVSKSPKLPAALTHHVAAINALKPAAKAKDPVAIARLDEAYQALGKEASEKFGRKAVADDLAAYLAKALQGQKSSHTETNPEQPMVLLSPPRKRFSAFALGVGVLGIIASGIMAATVWTARRPRELLDDNIPLASHPEPSREGDAIEPFFLSALADAKRAHELAGSLAAASLDGHSSQDIMRRCTLASEEIERDIFPTLRKYMFAPDQRPEAKEALLSLGEVLRLVQTEFDAVKGMAQSNNRPSTRLAFSMTSEQYEALHNRALRAMFPDAEGLGTP